jgi:hypothetical protein
MHVAANKDIQVKCPTFSSDFKQSHISQQTVIEHPKIKFHTNATYDSGIVTSEEMDRHGEANGQIFCNIYLQRKKKLG